jgi:hypothetical protein
MELDCKDVNSTENRTNGLVYVVPTQSITGGSFLPKCIIAY